MVSLLSLGKTLPTKWTLFVTDSNGPSGLDATGSAAFDPILDAPHPLCREMRNPYQNTNLNFTTTAKDPLAWSGIIPIEGSIGAGVSFLKWKIANNKIPAGYRAGGIFCGIGGTTQAYWKDGGSQAPSAITRANQAIAQNASDSLDEIVVVTGTNDAIANTSQAAYEADTSTLVSTYRAGITGATNVPFVFVGLVDGWSSGSSTAIRAAIAGIPARISKTACVNMTGLTGQVSGGTAFHFTAASQRLIGNPGIGTALANLSA